jgi:hypothetical protein
MYWYTHCLTGTFSSAGLSTPSPSFTFQQSPKDVKPYVSGLGNPFLFALPNSVAKEKDVPDKTVAVSQRKISQNAVLRARKRRAKEDLFGSGFRKRLYEIADEGESASDSDNDTVDQKPVTESAKSEKSLADSQPAKNDADVWNAPQYDYAYIISGYIQTGFNLFIVLVIVYLAVQAILTIQRDVQQKVAEYSTGEYVIHSWWREYVYLRLFCSNYEGNIGMRKVISRESLWSRKQSSSNGWTM